MHHLVALLNPLSCPLTQEYSQVSLEDMGMGMGRGAVGGVGGLLGHIFLTHFHSGRSPIAERYRLFQSSLKTPACLTEVILSFVLSLFQCSECQKLSTLTVTNVINPRGHRLHADVAKGSVIKLKQYSQDAPTKAGGTRLISTAVKTKEQVAVCEAPFCSLWILPW